MGCFDRVKSLRGPKVKPIDGTVGYYTKPPAQSVGWYWTPRVASRDDYQYDLDASERFTRPRRGIDYFPVPGIMQRSDQSQGFVPFLQGVLPQMNVLNVVMASYRELTPGPQMVGGIYSNSFGDIAIQPVQLG